MRRLAISLLVGVTVVISACGSPSDHSAVAGGESVEIDTTATAPSSGGGGSIRDAVEVMAAAPGQADDSVCDINRKTLETASEAYYALNGSEAATQQDLVDQGLILEIVPNFDVTDGAVTPSASSACT